jgi:hypothetical protein
MRGNLMASVTQLLTPDVIAKLARASGISDSAIGQKAVGAAVPTILSGLANLAAKPGGAQDLADVVANQPPDILENPAAAVGGPGQLADTGKTALASMFGNSTLGALASTLGRYAGVGEGSVRSLLGMIAPMILGVLRREAGSGASGLAQSLAAQKDSFAAAMPAGLSDLLKTSGVLDTVGAATPAASRVNEAYRAARDSAGAMARAVGPSASQSSARWMYWALPLLAVLGLLWYLFGDQRPAGPIGQLSPQGKVALTDTPIRDLQPQVASAIEQLRGTLRETRDWTAPRDVLPKLQQSAGEFDRLTALANRLPLETRERLAEAIKTKAAQLKLGLDDVDAMPRVAPNAKPVLSALRAKLDALALTPQSLAQQRAGLAADKVVYLARSPNDAVSLTGYFDRAVHSASGEKIGVVHDLIVGPDGSIAAVVVGVGGFLGIGEKEIAVPFAAMQIARREGEWHLVVETTKEALKDAPTYEDKGDRVRLAPKQ